MSDIRVVAECLRHCPDGLRTVPAVRPQALRELVHAGADILELSFTIVTATITIVRRADGPA